MNNEFRLFHPSDIPKQGSEFRYHDFDKIIIFLKGKVDYFIEDRTYSLMPCDIALVNHDEIHCPDIDQSIPYERIIVYLPSGLITSYKTEEYDLNECSQYAKAAHFSVLYACSLEKSDLFQIIWNLERARAEEGYANKLHRQVLFLESMIQLNRAYLAHRLDYLKTRHSDQKILVIVDYIGAHLSVDLNIGILSEAFYISKYHMTCQFKQETGCTISHYINNKHLFLTREPLSDDVPIVQIRYDYDFKNYSTFSRVYKSFFDESPKFQRVAGTG